MKFTAIQFHDVTHAVRYNFASKGRFVKNLAVTFFVASGQKISNFG